MFFSLLVIQKIIYIFNRCKYEKYFHNASSQYFNVPNDLSAICVNICMKTSSCDCEYILSYHGKKTMLQLSWDHHDAVLERILLYDFFLFSF